MTVIIAQNQTVALKDQPLRTTQPLKISKAQRPPKYPVPIY